MNNIWIATVLSHQFWYPRFMAGIHMRVEKVHQLNEAVTIDIMLQMQ